MTARVLVVDDEPRMAAAVAEALRRSGYECETCQAPAQALQAALERPPDVVVSDLRMPELDGLELMRRLRQRDAGLPVILITAYGDVRSAVEAMRAGAFDYVTKPFDHDELRGLVARALELRRLERENRLLRRELGARHDADLVAESAAMRAVLELVDRIAPARAPVLLQGESGTGKEMIARRLHFRSERAGGPFVGVNCAAFAESVLESELFGHERGAFTGAAGEHAGCFERAQGGTLLLDEIAEVGGDFQAKLLRVLQESEVLRVGGTRPRRIDVRVLAASHRELRTEVAAGRFREDLYFRLAVIPVRLPALRERRDDIVPLARHFLARHSAGGRPAPALSPAAEEALQRYLWPGNVRELANAIERAAVLARGPRIEPEDLLLGETGLGATGDLPAGGAVPGVSLQECLDRAARAHIRAALEHSSGRRAEAAVNLGIDRTTLFRWMKRLGL